MTPAIGWFCFGLAVAMMALAAFVIFHWRQTIDQWGETIAHLRVASELINTLEAELEETRRTPFDQ